MKVICAGLPKTGTKSLAAALRYLGYTVHDVNEHWNFHMNQYIQAFDRNMPDFKAMYQNIDAVTDMPACLFFEEIFRVFPDAKVILSVRDSEKIWAESRKRTVDVANSINNEWTQYLAQILTPTGRVYRKLRSYDSMCSMHYYGHYDKVKAVIPPDQLLVFNVTQGWQPLCAFLGHEAPRVQFPRRNVGSEMIPDLVTKAPAMKRMYRELTLIILGAVVLFSLCWQFMCYL